MSTLDRVRKSLPESSLNQDRWIMIGMGTCGLAAGAAGVRTAFRDTLDPGDGVRLDHTGCLGLCYSEVNVEIGRPGEASIIYGPVVPDRVAELVASHVAEGSPVVDLAVAQRPSGDHAFSGVPLLDEIPFLARQSRSVLANCGTINPDRLTDYLDRDGYRGLERALSDMDPEEVVEEVKTSGLRGRGGGGFPTGRKWEFTAMAKGDRRYVVCNADEGDPGAFMDRSILEGDPHAVLEGMIICGYAVGANEGYIYVRAEYPLAIRRLENALAEARSRGLLGDSILGSGFSFDLQIKAGAGAFVCGEETALLASIEGQRGMPRVRPPFPAQRGLWGMPTNINNVETYANIPLVLREGGDRFARLGTEGSKGTKVFAVTGKVVRTGLAEVEMGCTLRDIIFEIAGGIQDAVPFKAVQIGGPSGGCLPSDHIDLGVDYDSLIEAGAMMGSGGLVVMDETTCMVDVAKFFLAFTQKESCGKCTPCREGTRQMLNILNSITEGNGEPSDIGRLETLAEAIKSTSLCGLGQTAPNPVLTTLRYFRHEYDAHINEGFCPAGVCAALVTYRVLEQDCTGCTLCARVCPVAAISGERREPHVIDAARCIACGECIARCRFDAIVRVPRGGEGQ